MPHFIFIQQISLQNILNTLYNLHFFSSKRRLFHNATLFGFCITHILNTGCAKICKKVRHQKVNALKENLELNSVYVQLAPRSKQSFSVGKTTWLILFENNRYLL